MPLQPFSTRELRANVVGVGRPWMRDKYPVAAKDEEWRIASGLAYGANPLTGVFETGAIDGTVSVVASVRGRVEVRPSVGGDVSVRPSVLGRIEVKP